MPGRNGMGPMGQGRMMGRGVGWCRGANAQVEPVPGGPGFGMGRGSGRGGGRRNRFWFRATGLTGWQRAGMGWFGGGVPTTPAVSGDQELAVMKQQAVGLEQALADLKARIEGFDKPAPDGTGKEPR